MTLATKPAFGRGVGVGLVAGGTPGVSVQLRETEHAAVHGTARYGGGHAGLGVDYQRFFHPYALRGDGYRVGLYAGAGLAGEAAREKAEARQAAEDFLLRLPLGAQLTLPDLSFSLFTEAAAQIGPLPETAAGLSAAFGARAEF